MSLIAGLLVGVAALGRDAVGASTSSWALIAGAHLDAGFGGGLVVLVLGSLTAVGFGALGCAVALRTGSGEAVQGLFPLFFVFIFLSSSNLPRNLLQHGLVPHGRDVEPDLLSDRGVPQPVHRRLGPARRCCAASRSRRA